MRGVRARLTQALSRRVERVAAVDRVVARRFIRVIGMVDPPGSLARPSTLLRLARPTRPHPPPDGGRDATTEVRRDSSSDLTAQEHLTLRELR